MGSAIHAMGIQQYISKHILLLDGAMGTQIQLLNLTEEDYRGEQFKDHPSSLKGNNDLLCITRPHFIERIHLNYLEAGANIIETNTFNAQRISLDDYGLSHIAYELNLAAAKVAVAARDKFQHANPNAPKAFVAGAVGPTSKTCSLSPDVERPEFRAVNYNELKSAYREQVEGLLDGGVDAILVETIFDTLNAKAAFHAILDVMEDRNLSAITKENPNGDLAIMASGTITDLAGRTLSGQTAAAFAVSLEHVPLFSLGFNCALGAEQLLPQVLALKAFTNAYLSAYPNAGLPNAMGGYDESPETFRSKIAPFLNQTELRIIGGCCGTSPAHIRALHELIHSENSHA
jgi:5-methyltetrahydrofolate--homocysteine methyltransferase